ncbi:hypothetical protein K443DRAFT_106920, partial [Laccaria amethystina LaAM-08-1]
SIDTPVPACCSHLCRSPRFFWSSQDAFDSLRRINHLQYLERWETSCMSSCFGVNDVATLRHQVYANEHTAPQVMNQRRRGGYSFWC